MAPRTTKRKTQRRTHPVTQRELKANNPSIIEGVTDRLGPLYKLAIVLTGIGALLWGGAQVYDWSGARKLVSDVTLDHAINNVKTEVGVKIDATKNEVVHNQNQIKGEITTNLNELTKTLNSVAKSQTSAAMDQAEVQMRLGFTQKQSLQGQLGVVNQALAKDPNDQLALTRKMQLEDFIKQNDQYMLDAQARMTKLRSGQ
jgi:hypothetical protein